MAEDFVIRRLQRAHEERLRRRRRWMIAETEHGYEVHEWVVDGVAPYTTYPERPLAAARLLQLMGINHVVVPQQHPEEVCVAFTDIDLTKAGEGWGNRG